MAPTLDLAGHGSITALLGPTNTGKTHRCVARMLHHGTGMMGLPLRLLAQEVYERVCGLRAPDQVALVTGEVKRVPPGARYWICTTESMPLDRPFAFVGVDEIQLAADRQRGHVFTDRILRARGVAETWLLGADSMATILPELVPTVQIERCERLSRLRWAGHGKLHRLPPRSAVVAFSTPRVYELASRLRARHGGVAVVTGALSPRARNAQVALFEGGEVERIVATDAIGMGLNLDLHHVALADGAKFDGRQHRPLRPEEWAQIAGRAGRFRRDGSFGTTDLAEPPSDELIDAVESHRFAPVRRVYWRSADLPTDSVAALLAGLEAAPRRGLFVHARDADDERALRRMVLDERVQRLACRPDRVALLWEVARVPDFGGLSPEHHAEQLVALYEQLVRGDGAVADAWLDAAVRRLDRTDGDVEALTPRLAAIRTWATVAHRAGWVHDAPGWQGRIAALEERLGDALHERLVARFVDTRATALVGPDALEARVDGGVVRVGGVEIGAVAGVCFALAPGLSERARRAASRAVAPLLADAAARLADAPDGDLLLGPEGTLAWEGGVVARLARGDTWRTPALRIARLDGVAGPARDAVTRRLDRWRADWLARRDAWAVALGPRTAAGRGLVHALVQGEGAAPLGSVRALVGRLGPDRARLERMGVVVTPRAVCVPAVLDRVVERRLLAQVWCGAPVPLPDDGGVSPFAAELTAEVAFLLALVPVVAGWQRVDALSSSPASPGRTAPR